jgi:2-iminobutanoate/2-iminopropanoate deaminase
LGIIVKGITMLEHIYTADAPTTTGGYSQGVVANGFLFTCGMGPLDPKTGKVVNGYICVQTRQVFNNLSAILKVKKVDFSRVIKVTGHLENPVEDFAGYNEVFREFFITPFPAWTTVGSKLANMRVEIDVVVSL